MKSVEYFQWIHLIQSTCVLEALGIFLCVGIWRSLGGRDWSLVFLTQNISCMCIKCESQWYDASSQYPWFNPYKKAVKASLRFICGTWMMITAPIRFGYGNYFGSGFTIANNKRNRIKTTICKVYNYNKWKMSWKKIFHYSNPLLLATVNSPSYINDRICIYCQANRQLFQPWACWSWQIYWDKLGVQALCKE